MFLDLSFSFRMKPVWMLLEETTKKYTSTMWQLSAKVPSWLATRGSSTCSYFEVRTRLLRKSKNIFFLFNCTTRLSILEQTVPLNKTGTPQIFRPWSKKVDGQPRVYSQLNVWADNCHTKLQEQNAVLFRARLGIYL